MWLPCLEEVDELSNATHTGFGYSKPLYVWLISYIKQFITDLPFILPIFTLLWLIFSSKMQ
jgi:ABC-type multidrug transport system permease subunit